MKLVTSLLLITLSGVLLAQDPWKDVYKESAWADRDKWQKVDELIRQLQLQPGSKVADIGCHEGYMTFKLSKAVGKQGKVFAVDVTQYKLDKLQEHAKVRNASNIETIKGDYDDPKLPVNTFDAVIIMDAYHEMDDHDKILQHIKAALKPGGRLLLCEPISDARKHASREEQEGKHELGMSFAIEDLKRQALPSPGNKIRLLTGPRKAIRCGWWWSKNDLLQLQNSEEYFETVDEVLLTSFAMEYFINKFASLTGSP